MNIRSFFSPQIFALTTGLVCAAAHAVVLKEHEIASASSAQLRAAYLECDRISAQARVDMDFMVDCQRVGDALRVRDFGGDFELQLRWWRSAREAYRSRHETGFSPRRSN